MMTRAASRIEKNLAAAISDPAFPKDEVLRRIAATPSKQKFVMNDTWAKLALDGSLEPWRRLEAYKILIHRCLAYPCGLDQFMSEAITPMGVDESQIVDMTMAEALPIERNHGEIIYMVHLPIKTSMGPVAVYYAVDRETKVVERAGVYPQTDETEVH
jgi:hypothetical protein